MPARAYSNSIRCIEEEPREGRSPREGETKPELFRQDVGLLYRIALYM